MGPDNWAAGKSGRPQVSWASWISLHRLILILVTHRALPSFQRLVHPFEIPEIFSLPMDQGDVHYLKWLEEGMEEE